MSVELRWLGHASWQIKSADQTLLLDPFIEDSPTAPCKAADLSAETILVSHGHFDHVADVASIANRCESTVVACYEIATWFATQHQVKNTVGMNLGGTYRGEFGSCKMVQALHSSQLPDGSYGGNPAGFVLELQGKKIYFACDTALFSDMRLIGQAGIDLAVLPIGDLFTMGPADSIEAIKFVEPEQVLPCHYNTWPPIEQDAEAWAGQVSEATSAKPTVLQPGESFQLC